MKYGAHCYLFTNRWSDERLDLLDTARELGLDMFELSVGDDIVFDRRKTRDRAAALGLDLLIGPGGIWPLECDLSADDPADRARGLAWHRRQVDTAAGIGAAAYCGAMYAHPGVVKRRRPPADEYARTAEGLHLLAEYAAGCGVTIALEPMSHFRTHLVNTPAEIMRLIDMADHPNLKVLFDTYHIVTEIRSYASALRTVAPRLYALHACENDRGVPGGGLVPWEEVFSVLREIGFDGYIGLEGYNSSLDDFAYQRGMFHDVCPDGRAFVEQGIGFLKGIETEIASLRSQ
ncbi:MAG TPA: sugar phosphate isomerase/epimerase family protein [Bacteroidota bacterium]|nr:sugar phosphate isomerase/epimerase family protein [Bacteroidota bacterium]